MSLELERLKEYTFEIGPIRPPSEGGSQSLLIRATINCPWNLCRFCDTYKGKNFVYRSVEEIKRDIDVARAIRDEIKSLERKLGDMVWVARAIDAYQDDFKNLPSIINVFNWICSGARTAFLQDANSLIMRTNDLLEVIKYLKETFPSIERITSYARAKTLAQKTKSLEDLKILREVGLSRLHVGLESGDDEVLRYINKGVTSEEHIMAGIKVKEAGIELSEYVMLGLGGRDMWKQHAKNTIRVLNEIHPDFIRLRPYIPRKGTQLYEEYEKGNFQLTSPHERLIELKTFVDELEVESRLCFDHIMNSWYRKSGGFLFKQDYNGYKLPEEKGKISKLIEEGLATAESIHIHAKDLIELPHL